MAGAVQAALPSAGQRGDAGEAAPHDGIRAGQEAPPSSLPRGCGGSGGAVGVGRARSAAGCRAHSGAESPAPACRPPGPMPRGAAALRGAAPAPLGSAAARYGGAERSGGTAAPPPRLVAMETVVLPRGRGCRSPAPCAPAAAAGKDWRDPLRHPHSPDRCLAHGPAPAPAQTVLGWTALAPAGPKLAFPPPAQSLPARIFVADPRNQALQKSYTMQKHPPK